MGFFSDHEDSGNNNDGVQVFESRPDVVVHYRPLDDLPATVAESCMFVVGPNQINAMTIGAPVITAVVGELIRDRQNSNGVIMSLYRSSHVSITTYQSITQIFFVPARAASQPGLNTKIALNKG